MFLLVLFLSIVGVFAFCKLMKLLIIHCYCLQYIVIKHTIFFVVWLKISITHFLNSSQKPFIAFYNVKQKYAFTNAKSINVLSDIDFKCQRKHPIILFWWNMSINWCMNYFSDTPNPETQLSKDGSGAGFKVGKVKLHFEVHGLAFSIISCCPQQARATLWLFSLDPSAPENLH